MTGPAMGSDLHASTQTNRMLNRQNVHVDNAMIELLTGFFHNCLAVIALTGYPLPGTWGDSQF
jgi:hypothetical protein